MQQSFMDILFTDAAAKAVCWTLVHSLWQGLVAALVAGAVIVMTRKSAAVLRYNLLTADLVVFLLASVGTFWHELHVGGGASGEPANVVVVDGVQDAAGGVSIHARYAIAAPSSLERVGMFLNEHAVVVVMVWMACLMIQLVRMTGGLYRIHRLRHQRVFLPGECWQQRMAVLMARMGIEKKVVLLQSGSVKMPVTFGFLKPSILVPLGMLANLPAEQVETILLHELAHIRRSDYLANLLLHVGEAVFFFNPGVRWVAWLIREEREACCDDLVLAGVKDRNSYFEALIAFGEYATGKRSMALPLGGERSDLLWRIRRMLNQENKKLHLMEKTVLSFGLMAVMAIGLVSMKGAGVPGTPPVGRTALLQGVAERSAAVRVSMGQVADTVPAASGKTFGSAGKAPVVVLDTTGNSVMIDSMSASATSAGPNGIKITFSATHISAKNAATMAAGVMTIVNSRSTEEAPVAPMTTVMMAKGEPVAPVTGIVAPVGSLTAPITDVAVPVGEPIAPVTWIAAPAAPAPPVVENDQIKGIITDLEARGIIQGVEPLSFRLDKHGMAVNGVKVSEEVFAYFKDKYVKNPRNKFSYSHQGGSTSSTVWVY